MSEADTTALSRSSLGKLTSGAGSRLTENLLSSSGSIAAIGLITALLTTGFVLWFVLELRQQSSITAPMARTAAVLNASLNRSIAVLRGWTAYGDKNFITTREQIWQTNIEPSLYALEQYSRESYDTEAIDNVEELDTILRELKYIQWKIEDVAQTPGNNNSLAYYNMRLRPLRDGMLKALAGATAAYRSKTPVQRDTDFLADLMGFRTQIITVSWWLRDYLVLRDEYYRANTESRQQQLQLAAGKIGARLETMPRDDIYSALRWSLDEFSGWLQQSRQVMAFRASDSGHMARYYMRSEARPLLDRALKLSSELAETHAMAMETRTETLSRASYFVAAMAVLMGLLSGGSLLFSFRLKSQVQNVIEKARKLGQYELDRLIGKGGMGEVYLAHHAMLRRPTAIKLLRALNAQNLRAQQRFEREVKLACQLSHPNTIEIYDYGRTPAGIFYFAMEYLDGFNIDAMIEVSGPVPPGRVVHLLLQACGSLAEAHSQNILHRDIKPANIMVTQRGGVYDTTKVLDFGLAKDLASDDRSEADFIAGTPLYLAPEAILSADSYSAQSDLYALGSVAYFMLCGETIFPPAEMSEILAMQLDDEIPFPSERLGRPLPEDLEYLVMACLSKDPAQRPSSAESLATMLAACDCPDWTPEDAKLWWQAYAEAARNISRPGKSVTSAGVSRVQPMFDASRM